ncbi:SusD/RagB family nutrient-binding outer membrane lipoprotein [Niabella insulamsoli]|uniref:SusD/RagB family nutrient-binding outer membrane lipoprotein n=1 Tax=Niabella insulamsoli TaxID=3144874 RepID=UPI0031FD34F2
MGSCTRNFDKINTDPNSITNVSAHQLLAPALRSTLSYCMIRNRNFNNELMQVTVNISDADNAVFRYDFRNTFSDYLWNGLFSELTNFKDMYYVAMGDSTNPQKSYMGIALIMQAHLYSLLTDTYGDIPFTEANSARKEFGDIKEPAFDRQKDIYMGLFSKLDLANELLGSNQAIDVQSDPVFHGNVEKWRRFGNSLYLRLLLRVSGKSEVSATVVGKIKEMIDTNPANYPIMEDNDDSAILRWMGASYVSPYSSNVRAQDFRDPALCSFFIDYLWAWKDPRLDGDNYGVDGINRWGIAKSGGLYSGVPSGYAQGDDIQKGSYFYAIDQTVEGRNPPARTLQNEPMTGMIMNYAETQFILAEAALKGWISGSAESYYKKGAENSITLWLPEWNQDIDSYLTTAGMQWNDAASQSDLMEKIHLQKYYALFLTDLQQWFEYRRTGHPVLPKGAGLQNGGVMPGRMVYPVYVQSTNPTNYRLAVDAQGPDIISTQVWWQKP